MIVGAPFSAGLILAGGSATRFGGIAKGTIMLHGETLISRILENMERSVTPVGINTVPRLANSYADLKRPIVFDDPAHLNRGPLAGLLAGLEWAADLGARRLWTSPCDAPFLPADMGQKLLDALEGPFDVGIACTLARDHFLCAAWRVSVAAPLRLYLSRPDAKLAVKSFLAQLRIARVSFADEADFLNINTAEDLQTAERRLA